MLEPKLTRLEYKLNYATLVKNGLTKNLDGITSTP